MSELAERVGLTVMFLLLLVALASVVTLWTLDPTSTSSQSVFAVYLAIDLVSFAMMSYIYRVSKGGESIRRLPLICGCVLLLLLVGVGFAFYPS